MASFRPAYLLAAPSVDKTTASIASFTSDFDIKVIPWVSSITYEPTPALALSLTQDKVVVEGHPAGVRLHEFSLTGSVQWPTLKSHGARDTDSVDRGAASESSKRLQTVRDLCMAALQTDRKTLYFYAVDEGVALEVVPRRLRLERGQGRDKIGFGYSLTFTGVKQIAKLVLLDPRPSALKAATVETTWQKMQGALSTVEASLDVVKAVVYETDAALRQVESILSEIDSIISTVAWLVAQPRLLSARLKGVYNRCINLLSELASALDSGDVSYNRAPTSAGDGLAIITPSSSLLRSEAQRWKAMADTFAIAALAAQMATGTQDAVQRWWTVGTRDTLESIALATTGNAANAASIAASNGLKYPWTGDGDKSLRPGDKLQVPNSPSAASLTAPTGNEETSDEAIYGIDVRLDSAGDLYRVGADDDVDFALVGGVLNMEQAILQRMTTIQGSNREWSTYGLPSTIGRGAFSDEYAAYLVAITTGFLQDDRVVSVTQLEAEDVGNGWRWSGLINLVSGIQLARTGGTA